MRLHHFVLIMGCLCCLQLSSCSGDDPAPPKPDPVKPKPDPEPEPEKPKDPLADYIPPAYPDDYRGVADWSKRSQWNLANVHDPTVFLADDGFYYMYQTDASYGNAHERGGHFHCRRSRNLVDWEYLGGTMVAAPEWVKTKVNAYRTTQGLPPITNPQYGFWAPVARNLGNGTYRMYYCIVLDNLIKTGNPASAPFDNSWTERAFIGMAETTRPADNVWTDKGFIICSASDKGMNDWYRANANAIGDWDNAYFLYNAIDPTYTITPEGEHWLTYGSWHSGIATLKVDPTTGMPLQALGEPWNIQVNSPYGKLIYRRGATGRWQGSEGPEIVYNEKTGYYYLFMAYDELSVAYNTRVARSRRIDGPYEDINGREVTTATEMLPVVTHPYKFANSNGWVGISHCAIFNDGKGNWYYASQGRFPKDVPGINASNALMMGHIRAISWTDDGWPVVMPERYGAVPEVAITERELVGDWEHIDLSYRYGVQKESTIQTLSEAHKVTAGPWKDQTWNFDATKQVLTIGNIKLLLRREVDWEANPRHHTIVYGAYTNTKTYWGKKKK